MSDGNNVRDPGADLFGRGSDSDSSADSSAEGMVASCTAEITASQVGAVANVPANDKLGHPSNNAAGKEDDDDDGKEPGMEVHGVVAPEKGNGVDPETAAVGAAGATDMVGAAGGAGGAGGGEGGSQPRKMLPGMDPEEALRAFAESVGMSVDAMWEFKEDWRGRMGVTRGDGGEIVEIDWSFKDLKGTLPVGDMHMPYLRKLDFRSNGKLKGEARGVGVAVVKFTDCFCE